MYRFTLSCSKLCMYLLYRPDSTGVAT